MISAIIVTYNPEQSLFMSLINACLPQVDNIIVVDNGSTAPVKAWLDGANTTKIIWIPLGENKGIAKAHNTGIAKAKELGAKAVIIFDHDSVPTPHLVAQLAQRMAEKQNQGIKVAAIGPCYKDDRQENPPPFIRIEGLKLVRVRPTPQEPVVRVDYIVSSGSLIPMETLDAVGGMNEALFIDYIDIEWGLRAKLKGYQCFGAGDVFMEHSLGDAPLCVFGQKYPLHSPLRHYYLFRNAVWLYKQPQLPLNWKLVDGWRLLLKYGCYTLCAPPRLSHFINMTHGMIDGLRNKLGKKA